jgi:hypothetical protein
MCESVEAVVEHAEVLVVGSASGEAARALAATRPDQVVVDLTRGAVRDLLVPPRDPVGASSTRGAV